MRIALDTNILAYAEAVNGEADQRRARRVIEDRLSDELFVPVQVLLELANVLRHKTGSPSLEVAARVKRWADNYEVIGSDTAVVEAALELVSAHQIGWWDAVVLASAATAQCRLLLTEDMQDGFSWRGVIVRNPFAA